MLFNTSRDAEASDGVSVARSDPDTIKPAAEVEVPGVEPANAVFARPGQIKALFPDRATG
jgi:hypothetical protein